MEKQLAEKSFLENGPIGAISAADEQSPGSDSIPSMPSTGSE
jgi:hypothetical protein